MFNIQKQHAADRELLMNCSRDNSGIRTVKIYKEYVSDNYRSLLIDIELHSNIQELQIYNSRDQDIFIFTTLNLHMTNSKV